MSLPVRLVRGRMRTEPGGSVRLRLICFPYAGAGAAVFRQWADDLPNDIELCIPCLPCRDARQDEPPAKAMAPLVAALAAGLRRLADHPYALFGHSMGAFVAFDLAHELAAMGQPPTHLFASAQRGPSLPFPGPPIFDLSDADFLAAILDRYQAIPQPLLREPEMMALLLRRLRGDFTLAEDYRYSAAGPLDCPVTVFGGLEDRQVGREQLRAWSRETSAGFDVHMLPGGHFFVNDARPSMLAIIRERLARPPGV